MNPGPTQAPVDETDALAADANDPVSWLRRALGIDRRIFEGSSWAVAASLPLVFGDPYQFQVATLILIYVPLVIGQNLITGNAGLISMGHAAFFGAGAYTSAILATNYNWAMPQALALSVLVAAVLGVLVGLPAIRVAGDYLFIVTIGFTFILVDVVTQWKPVTGGAEGIPGVPAPSVGPLDLSSQAGIYYFALVAAFLAFILARAMLSSRLGRVLEAVRDDPLAAAACGVRATPLRVSVFAIGAAMGGLAGSVLAYDVAFVGPQEFNIATGLLIFEMAIIGGLGSIWGSIIGAVVLIGLPEVFRPLIDYRIGIGGAAVIALMIFRPQGIAGRVRIINLIKK
jgi:branched-chain amino acid transport system permease protein